MMLGAILGFIIGILIDIPFFTFVTHLLSLIQDSMIAYILGHVILAVSLVGIPFGFASLFSSKSGV
jgi:hypothetical protein